MSQFVLYIRINYYCYYYNFIIFIKDLTFDLSPSDYWYSVVGCFEGLYLVGFFS